MQTTFWNRWYLKTFLDKEKALLKSQYFQIHTLINGNFTMFCLFSKLSATYLLYIGKCLGIIKITWLHSYQIFNEANSYKPCLNIYTIFTILKYILTLNKHMIGLTTVNMNKYIYMTYSYCLYPTDSHIL